VTSFFFYAISFSLIFFSSFYDSYGVFHRRERQADRRMHQCPLEQLYQSYPVYPVFLVPPLPLLPADLLNLARQLRLFP
jgi:hypothetical protein